MILVILNAYSLDVDQAILSLLSGVSAVVIFLSLFFCC